jgi:hypothetical protein
MSRFRTALRRPWIGATAALVIALLISAAAAGGYLAAHPSLPVWSGARPGTPISVLGTSGYDIEVLRAGDQYWLNVPARTRQVGPATPLGKAAFTVFKSETGWPRGTSIDWRITLTNVVPGPGAPPPSDEQAWRRAIAEALVRTVPEMYPDLPGSIRAGDDRGTSLHPRAFVLNAAERLWHAPTWLGLCIGLAAAVALAVGIYLHGHPRLAPGACRACGYDMTGLSTAICPECGATRQTA